MTADNFRSIRGTWDNYVLDSKEGERGLRKNIFQPHLLEGGQVE